MESGDVLVNAITPRGADGLRPPAPRAALPDGVPHCAQKRTAAKGSAHLLMSEDDLKGSVIELAHDLGWMVVHQRPARTAKGWRTAIEGDAGFLDLVLARRGVVLFRELKSMTGRLSVKQKAWMHALGESAAVWTPADWPDRIRKELA